MGEYRKYLGFLEYWVLWLIAVIVIFIDQISKIFAKNMIKNTGAAFGLFQNSAWFLSLIGFAVIVLIFYCRKNFKSYGLIGLGFLLGGTASNLIDRLTLGYVRDFISISIWPAFNFADVANVIGVLILIVWFLKKE